MDGLKHNTPSYTNQSSKRRVIGPDITPENYNLYVFDAMVRDGRITALSPAAARTGGPEGGVRAASGGGALGLSTAHISASSKKPIGFKSEVGANSTIISSPNSTQRGVVPQYTVNDSGGTAAFWVGASLVRVKRPSKNALLLSSAKGVGGNRSYVSGFSRSSRLRLMRLLATLRRDCVPIFITLTYPSSWPSDPKDWKRHLDNFRRQLFRLYPGAALVWKLEAQKRGAPHFHCLLYGIYEIQPGFLSWVSETWFRVVGSGDEKHLRAGTRVEYLRSHRGAMSYAAKYMDKTVEELPEEWGKPGRFWGVCGRDNLPTGEVVEVPLSWAESVTVQRWLRRSVGLANRDRHTETIFVNRPEDFMRVLDALPVAGASTGVN